MMTWRHSITLRLTLLFALASTAVLLAVGVLIGLVVESHFEDQDLAELRGKLQLTQHALGKVRSATDLEALPQQLDDALIGHPGLSVAVIDPDNRILFSTPGADFPQALLKKKTFSAPPPPLKPVIWEHDGHAYSGIATPVPTGLDGVPAYLVAIAVDIEHRRQFMHVFQKTLWALFIFGIVLSAVLGWFAAHQGLSPVRRIAAVTKGISASQLTDRMPLDTVPTELRELAESFNGMLSRLEDSFRRLSDFSSDLAHELRAPISNLMTQTQVALTKARSADDYRDVLASNLEEYDRLARMVSDMLFLAKADHGLWVPQRDLVDLEAEISQLVEFYEPLSQESGVPIVVRGNGTFVGDRLMIRRAMSNLLSNAVRHAQRDGTVSVTITDMNNGEVSIVCENPGAAIPPDHIPHLFDRFYRVDPARSHGSEGVGLGLAITKSIVESHGGRIVASSNRSTTRFEIALPNRQRIPRERQGS
ncbi:MAG TPA: heavy metal sensor histidine kinase [Gammaproteobacteria bacterium]